MSRKQQKRASFQLVHIGAQLDRRKILLVLLHSLGKGPEHQRIDRDNYVYILWHNIYPGRNYKEDMNTPGENRFVWFGQDFPH